MRMQICKAFTAQHVDKGDVIVAEGELADAFYVVCQGTVGVTIRGKSPSWGGVLGAGSGAEAGASFGELGLAEEGVSVVAGCIHMHKQRQTVALV